MNEMRSLRVTWWEPNQFDRRCEAEVFTDDGLEPEFRVSFLWIPGDLTTNYNRARAAIRLVRKWMNT